MEIIHSSTYQRSKWSSTIAYEQVVCVHSGSTNGASNGKADKAAFWKECKHFLFCPLAKNTAFRQVLIKLHLFI